MYTSNNPLIDGVKRPHSFFDRHLDISDGKPTIRRLVTNVYKYFDDDSFAVQDAFEDIFGGDSFIYNQHKYKREIKYFVNRYIKLAHINSQDDYTESPYEYRKDSFGGYDISHEFFQMFRYTTLQSRWAYSMYFLAKGKSNSFITFSNLVRITCNCSLYGKTKGVRDYKFIQFLVNEYVKNMRDIEVIKSYKKRKDNILDPFGKEDESNEMDFDHIETLFIENLFRLLIASTIQVHEDKNYISLNELKMMYEKIINEKTILNKDTKIKIGKELKEVLQSLEGFDLVNNVIA